MSTIEEMINDIEEAVGVGGTRGGIDLSSWEEDFFDSVRDQFEERGRLSDKQKQKLSEIWGRI